ncbi:peptidoglycan endopeptidase [Lactobacillus kimbladii]|uniref:C40 family peptidase n=1 Tax=Lactobacillus kimbladii TaxID=1218506 RepID=UPI00164F83E4|nr:C40 family peptidase [Lactobacillus kimbladii]MBC6341673.1 peptidoglycan endopeptidase [Lactobacillus kimbladii]
MKRNFWKMGFAAALTLTGIGVVSPQKAVDAATLKVPIKRIQISCLPNKDVKIWTNFEGGQLISFRAKNKSKWNVAKTAVDRKGKLWYMIGDSEWIEARYTEDLEEKSDAKTAREQVKSVATKKKDKKIKPKKALKVPKKQKVQKQKVMVPSLNNVIKKKSNKTTVNPINLGNRTVSNNSSSDTSRRAQAVVSLAESQLGKGYVWGGNGPDNYDCSGLVQYVYNEAGGVKLPRVTTDQVKVGQTVAMSQLHPGDLLYWGSTDAPYHVGIYVGNNQYVSAATPEQGVVLQTISSYFYPCIAKRVLL